MGPTDQPLPEAVHPAHFAAVEVGKKASCDGRKEDVDCDLISQLNGGIANDG